MTSLEEMLEAMHHPILGKIRDVYKASEWHTDALKIGVFPLTAQILFHTDAAPPTPMQVELAVKIVSADANYVRMVARLLKNSYMTTYRQYYLALIGDVRYQQNITAASIPEIHEPEDVWVLFHTMTVWIHEDLRHSFELKVRFDPEHDFAARFAANGTLIEVLLDG